MATAPMVRSAPIARQAPPRSRCKSNEDTALQGEAARRATARGFGLGAAATALWRNGAPAGPAATTASSAPCTTAFRAAQASPLSPFAPMRFRTNACMTTRSLHSRAGVGRTAEHHHADGATDGSGFAGLPKRSTRPRDRAGASHRRGEQRRLPSSPIPLCLRIPPMRGAMMRAARPGRTAHRTASLR